MDAGEPDRAERGLAHGGALPGTDDLYLGYYARFAKPGGQIGIVIPGLQHEFSAGLPKHLTSYWKWGFTRLVARKA